MSDIRKIISLFKSRTTIIELLAALDYVVEDYQSYSVNEIDAMQKNDQLDMLVTHKTNGKKVYVKYYLPDKQKQITRKALDAVIEDLYEIDKVLTQNDTLCVVIDDEPNSSNISKMNYLYDHDGIFIVMHNIKRLQYNISMHDLVPKMTILSEDETKEFMIKMNISSLSQLPEISRYDPQALSICLRPKDVCRIERTSVTALKCLYYRVCV
jgi:DNA-directed RNA polymerase subunit H (RpoH/RPB5)